MPKLVAEFQVRLPGHCLYSFPSEFELNYSVPVGEFQVQLVLTMPKGTNGRVGDANWTGALRDVKILVSREEAEFPPPVIPNASGCRDYSVQSSYFSERVKLYSSAGREVTNRLIRFFRYSLGTPYLKEFSEGDQDFQNPDWKNEAGHVVGEGSAIWVVPGIPGLFGNMAVGRLSSDNSADLESFLISPQNYSVAEQLLDNARTAWFDENYQRTILELAIACEIVVKRRFFAKDSPAGAAFDYLEDKAKVNVKVLELIDSVAQEAFSKSFKAEFSLDYRNIDYLFRCRNKIAHRGELSFRDDSGLKSTPNRKMIEEWFLSVLKLKEWLQT